MSVPVFPASEYDARLARVRANMGAEGLDAVLVRSPENVDYLIDPALRSALER